MFFSIIHTLKNSTKTVSKDVPTTIAKVMTAPECIGMGSRENNSYIIFKWNIFLFVMHKKYLGGRVASNFFYIVNTISKQIRRKAW